MIQFTENQWLTLLTVRQQGPLSVKELSKQTGEPDTGERTRLERMEALGLVKRQRVGGGKQRNRHWWQITDAGSKALKEAGLNR